MDNPVARADQIAGWMYLEELEWLYEAAKRMASVVEVGSWQGRSTFVLLSGCRGPVVAVDKWDAELMKDHGDALVARKAFFENTTGFANLTVMEMDSPKAATAFPDNSVEMVFIDGNHLYEPFKADLLAWLPKAKKLICGHDYLKADSPGVQQALDEYFGPGKVQTGPGSLWYVDL